MCKFEGTIYRCGEYVREYKEHNFCLVRSDMCCAFSPSKLGFVKYVSMCKIIASTIIK
jgi:hypothetical protein